MKRNSYIVIHTILGRVLVLMTKTFNPEYAINLCTSILKDSTGSALVIRIYNSEYKNLLQYCKGKLKRARNDIYRVNTGITEK